MKRYISLDELNDKQIEYIITHNIPVRLKTIRDMRESMTGERKAYIYRDSIYGIMTSYIVQCQKKDFYIIKADSNSVRLEESHKYYWHKTMIKVNTKYLKEIYNVNNER